ncbi:MAG: hypothetical protein ACU0BS_13870 [Hasllibacter sp.]
MSKRRWIARMTEEAAKVRKPAPWARDAKPVIRIRQEPARDLLTDAA